jgi:hypothetical protein
MLRLWSFLHRNYARYSPKNENEHALLPLQQLMGKDGIDQGAPASEPAFFGISWKNMYVLDPLSCWLPMVLGARHQQVLLKPAVTHMSCGASGIKNQKYGLPAWNNNVRRRANTS